MLTYDDFRKISGQIQEGFFLLSRSFLYVRQVSSQYIVVVYPEKRMLGVISLSLPVSDYEVKIHEW